MTCDRCDREVGDAYEIRDYGTDPETGYVDKQLICYRCAGGSYDDFDDERDAEADRKLTARYEEGDI